MGCSDSSPGRAFDPRTKAESLLLRPGLDSSSQPFASCHPSSLLSLSCLFSCFYHPKNNLCDTKKGAINIYKGCMSFSPKEILHQGHIAQRCFYRSPECTNHTLALHMDFQILHEFWSDHIFSSTL